MTPFDPRSETAAVAPQTTVTLSARGTRGCTVVDRWVSGAAGGGVRFVDRLDRFELAHLARAMTLKYAFVNFPLGGAKTALAADRPADGKERARLLDALGSSLRPLRGRYFPGKDVGLDDGDLEAIMTGMGSSAGKAVDSAAHTALTVTLAAEEWLRVLGLDLRGARVAVEGFGSVGGEAARLLAERGCRIVAVSTARGALYDPEGLDLDRLLAARREHHEEFVLTAAKGRALAEPTELLRVDCDLLVLCGLSWSLRAATIPGLKCRLVVPGANCPATDEARSRLANAGITMLPDFACNSGGVVGSAFERLGATRAEATAILETDLRPRFRRLFADSVANGEPPERQARAIARTNLERRSDRRVGLAGPITARLLAAVRAGGIPATLLRALGIPALRRSIRRGHATC